MTFAGRWNDPYPSAHSKKRFPLTAPSFFPTGSSKATPTHHPLGSPSTFPTNFTTPRFPPGFTSHRFPTWSTIAAASSAWCSSSSIVRLGTHVSPRFSAIAFSRHHVGSLASCSFFHCLYVFSRALYASSDISYFFTFDTSSSHPPAEAECASVSSMWMVHPSSGEKYPSIFASSDIGATSAPSQSFSERRIVLTFEPTCVMSFSLTRATVICRSVGRRVQGQGGTGVRSSGRTSVESSREKGEETKKDGTGRFGKRQIRDRRCLFRERRGNGRTAARGNAARTYRSKRISMNRAFRLLCVTISSTVLSALFSDPVSAVTYSRRFSRSVFLMGPS